MILMDDLKAELKRLDIKQTEFAKMLGITPAAIQKWFNGDTQPTMKRYNQILEILDKEKVARFNAVGSNNIQIGSISNSNNVGNNYLFKDDANIANKIIREVPVLSYSQAPTYIKQQNIVPNKYEVITFDNYSPQKCFAIEMIGNSMNYYYSENQILNEKYKKFSIAEGELAIVDIAQVNLEDLIGKLIVAQSNEGTTIKLLYQEENNLFLMPLNSRFQKEEKIKILKECDILGKVIKIITPDRNI